MVASCPTHCRVLMLCLSIPKASVEDMYSKTVDAGASAAFDIRGKGSVLISQFLMRAKYKLSLVGNISTMEFSRNLNEATDNFPRAAVETLRPHNT